MGHANLENISRRVNSMLHAGTPTIKEMVAGLEQAKQAVHASEGQLTDPCMLSLAVQEIISILYEERSIEPAGLTRAQKRVFKEWTEQGDSEWDCGDDGTGGQYGVFDTIRWCVLKKRLSIVREVTH